MKASSLGSLALAVGLSTLGSPAAANDEALDGGALCAAPKLDKDAKLSSLSPALIEKVEATVDRRFAGATDLADVDHDGTVWVDACGVPYYREPIADVAQPQPRPEPAIYPESETFNLSSRPGATKTIYLDFRGGAVTNSAWNNDPDYGTGSVINYAPYSTDASSAYSSAELASIQQVWAYVSEDFAPFNVNVTTVPPAAGVLTKDFDNDPVYGIRSVITQVNDLGANCGCGGIAYVGITSISGAQNFAHYNPAWVFADRLYTARNIAEASSHELGHNLGLNHDGTPTAGYYPGHDPWAPIMGVSYSQPLSQWSKGEYSNATNKQDDLSIIASSFPYVTDDHVSTSTAIGQEVIANNGTAYGMVSNSADADVFKFSGANWTTITVTPNSLRPNLDINLSVFDSSGTPWDSVNPTTTKVSADQANGLAATYTVQLPATPATYHVMVSGAGQGNLTTGYSNYGSTGPYSVKLTTESNEQPDPDPEPPTPPNPPQPPTPEEPETPKLPAVQFPEYGWENLSVGRKFDPTKLVSYGGDGSNYWWSSTGLPPGLTLDATGLLHGTPEQAGEFKATVTVASGTTLSSRVTAVRTFTFSILPELLVKKSSTLPKAKKGKSYSQAITGQGGLAPYSWKLKGSLPRGLKLTTIPGKPDAVAIKGKTKKTGTYRFSLLLSDTSGVTVTKKFTLKVKPRR